MKSTLLLLLGATAVVGLRTPLAIESRATPSVSPLSRRAAVSTAAAALVAAAASPAAYARPEGVNKPELLPSGPVTNVIQMADNRYLTTGEVTSIDKQLAKLQEATNIKFRVLCQSYPNTPGLAIKDYWGLDDRSIVMVVDKGQSKGGAIANILNFNVAEGVKLSLPNQFWTRLQSTFGNNFFVRENGEDIAIPRQRRSAPPRGRTFSRASRRELQKSSGSERG